MSIYSPPTHAEALFAEKLKYTPHLPIPGLQTARKVKNYRNLVPIEANSGIRGWYQHYFRQEEKELLAGTNVQHVYS